MSQRLWFIWIVAACLVFTTGLKADEPSKAFDVSILDKAMQEAIAQAEPAIASISVSRSDEYANFRSNAPTQEPGELGDFIPPQMPRGPWRPMGGVDSDLVKRLDLANPKTVPESFGSGIVIDPSGLILTNYHVVRDATKVYVRLPGGKASYADIHAADWRSDLAVLRMRKKETDLKVLPRGDGARLKKGQFILTIGNPFAAGFRDGSPSASWGIVSNLRQRINNAEREDERTKPLNQHGTLITIDARLNLGCSGGAVLDLKGRLVGLTSSQAAIAGGDASAGFAVPLTGDMWHIVDKLKNGEEVEYGFLGVQLDPRINNPNSRDVVILSSVGGSGADMPDEDGSRKIMSGDRILKIDGVSLDTPDDLFAVLGVKLAGSLVKVQLARGGIKRETTIKLAKHYTPGKSIVTTKPIPIAGLRVDYTSALTLRDPPSADNGRIPAGVYIREVLPNSPAQDAKLQVDQIITRANGLDVNSPTDFYAAAAKDKARLTLTTIKPDGRSEDVTLKLH
jgi:S1-C subfamily serine protease